MARPSRTGGKISEAKARKASRAKGSKTTKTTRRTAPAANPPKRFSVYDLKQQLERCRDELLEAREQQAATAEILKVINASPGDLTPVFNIILEKAHGLCDVPCGSLQLFDDGHTRAVAVRGMTEPFEKFLRRGYRLDRSQPVQSGRPFQIDDLTKVIVGASRGSPLRVAIELGGLRTMLSVPLVRNGVVFGRIVAGRQEVRPFSEHQIAVLQSFADQALIAIENARLFNETREALERQAATSEILKVIASSPSDVQPVFQAIATSANRLLGGFSTAVFRFVDDIAQLAAFTPTTPAADEVLQAGFPSPLTRFEPFKLAQGGQPVQIPDIEVLPESQIKQIARARGFRSMLFSPLMSDVSCIGLISVTRLEPGEFAAHHVQLLQTFADQAVIAIENVRLFDEVQAKTRDLTESLQQQTATADVLKVISRSAFDLQAVLDTLVESAAKLCEADEGVILQPKGDAYALVSDWGLPPGKRQFIRQLVFRPGESTLTSKVLTEGKVIHIHDVLAEPEFMARGDPDPPRTRLGVPLLRDGTPAGVFVLTRREVQPFTDRQIELVHTFAAQAVIAVENARLFNETKEALERQTATAEILKVIASSPDDVQPVFDAIAERSNRIVEGRATAVFSLADNVVHLMAFTPMGPEADTRLQASFPRPLSQVRWGEMIDRGEMLQTADLQDPSIPQDFQDLARLGGYRSQLVVPLLSEDKPIGAIAVTRAAPGKFADHHIQLLHTFADQAVIAISNVELFQEVQQRTMDLSRSLDDLRAAQDRLIQTEKLASLVKLTEGIAHEIKNQLNFVNNFSALSAELTDELNDTLKTAALTDKMRDEVDELTKLLKENLEKIVQHGKRADSIVKNMLLHSREGSGELRPADINALLDESLNLAYHGARAEKPDFNITLQREFDASAGATELFPQEITRAFINLISNGFYAATKRKSENGEANCEPTLSATTKNLGASVEIRIRDNGTGISPEVKENMFNPFFTTKPAGEGTGLGLSMTYDIIVRQHGGTIRVDTEPGVFTEFIVTLPRSTDVQGNQRSTR